MKRVSLFQIKITEEDVDKANRGQAVPSLDLMRDLLCFGSEKWDYQKYDFSEFFSFVASITSTSESSDGALEDAFMAMQRLDENSTPENNPSVTDMTGENNYRSMSVGDIAEVDDKYYMVDGVGFIEIIIGDARLLRLGVPRLRSSYEPDYDDPMDGDHESALASVGWGTDEDYGLFE